MSLEEMEARAQRHLDGMTVNRDAMARDVLKLCALVRRIKEREEQQQPDAAGAEQRPGMAAAFDDIFGSIFGKGAGDGRKAET